MATIEPVRADSRNKIVLGIAASALVVVLLAFFVRGTPPQMGADKNVFTNVDALFTAVTARDLLARAPGCRPPFCAIKPLAKCALFAYHSAAPTEP